MPRPGAVVISLRDRTGVWGMRDGLGMERRGRLTVPSSLHVALNPLFNRRNIFFRVFKIFSDVGRLAACNEAVLWRFARLGVDGPATVLDAR